MPAVPSTMLPLGTPAPDFALVWPATGETWRLSEHAGAPALVVAFVCNHCPYVRHIGPRLGEVGNALMEAGATVVAINPNDVDAYPDDAPDRMVETAAAWGWRFPYLHDEDQTVAAAYRAACTPDLFVFDADRRLAYRGQFDGSRPGNDVPVTGEDLDRAVRAVLAGRPVDGEQHPSLGCSIKWKPGREPDWAR